MVLMLTWVSNDLNLYTFISLSQDLTTTDDNHEQCIFPIVQVSIPQFSIITFKLVC